ncbi:hypothetical protein RvY_19151 [Ramazzottius varieornatus]|uniref:Uncharacterized protein n=1 Tax=Ramazzottius varieornatus TaxID=947166 RepID=A0A1D1W8G2_RAMVA|nr:hypothetical protein RvY_19151 [Ramazzottius varieornatus]
MEDLPGEYRVAANGTVGPMEEGTKYFSLVARITPSSVSVLRKDIFVKAGNDGWLISRAIKFYHTEKSTTEGVLWLLKHKTMCTQI